jgi:F0F1-type ATP synthase membrane subunit b/b'
MNEVKTIADRIKQLEKDLSSAETKLELHEKRLSELKSQVQEIENSCKTELNMSVKELPDFIKTNESKIVKLLDDLESKRDKINEGYEE